MHYSASSVAFSCIMTTHKLFPSFALLSLMFIHVYSGLCFNCTCVRTSLCGNSWEPSAFILVVVCMAVCMQLSLSLKTTNILTDHHWLLESHGWVLNVDRLWSVSCLLWAHTECRVLGSRIWACRLIDHCGCAKVGAFVNIQLRARMYGELIYAFNLGS